ncbi:hypothetical protein JK364_23810 [Streptomyces sp. 110]|uniref:Uncharacterized protein n=1 Tax=Streptomyces endocoffeicus TaxID=2898945 RepID=A0ABS1PSJ1_9ACTN|nr:hypothetical protein [Streptomyces endocoffeicus]MBL1115401.1 hypothetical protein [Streptomyces endocoffeicus]
MKDAGEIVRSAIELRDVVIRIQREGRTAFVRRSEQESPSFRIIGHPTKQMSLDHLFKEETPPVYMENIAQAMAQADRAGEEVPVMIVYTEEEKKA